MTTLFELLRNETEASVRMLASGGYPWTVVPVDKRETYLQALESASVDQDIMPFAQFIADCMKNPIRE